MPVNCVAVSVAACAVVSEFTTVVDSAPKAVVVKPLIWDAVSPGACVVVIDDTSVVLRTLSSVAVKRPIAADDNIVPIAS